MQDYCGGRKNIVQIKVVLSVSPNFHEFPARCLNSPCKITAAGGKTLCKSRSCYQFRQISMNFRRAASTAHTRLLRREEKHCANQGRAISFATFPEISGALLQQPMQDYCGGRKNIVQIKVVLSVSPNFHEFPARCLNSPCKITAAGGKTLCKSRSC